MATVIQSFQGQAGIKIETVAGTYRAPTLAQDFFFYTACKVEDLIEDNVDESFRGQAAADQGFYPGFRSARVTITQPFAQFPTGYLLKAFFGTDTATGAGDPFTHTYTELDTAAPATYTITVFDATTTNARAMVNCILQRLRFTLASKGLVVVEAVFLGKFDSTANAKPTAVYDTSPHYVPYQMAATINSVGSTKVTQWETICEREVEPVFGFSGTQDLTAVSGNRIRVTGSIIFAPADNTEADYYRLGTVVPISLLFTNTGGHTFTWQQTATRLINGTFIDQSGPYIRVNAKYRAIRNATDAGPATAILLNAVAVAGYN